jgi:hypothetical protein
VHDATVGTLLDQPRHTHHFRLSLVAHVSQIWRQNGALTMFRMRKCTRMHKVFETFAQRKTIPLGDLCFIREDECVGHCQTPNELNLRNFDVIKCYIKVPLADSLAATDGTTAESTMTPPPESSSFGIRVFYYAVGERPNALPCEDACLGSTADPSPADSSHTPFAHL